MSVPRSPDSGLQGLVLDLTQWRDASDTLTSGAQRSQKSK
jgi:hypothetical protein